MPVVPALQVLAELCGGEAIVVTNQAAARIWPKLRERSLDFHYNPSTMGGAIPLALGLALAQPERQVVAVTGDGSLLMSLGGLVSVSAARATNLSIILLDNGLYEVTGGQRTPGAAAAVDYLGLARAAGLASVANFDDLPRWQSEAARELQLPGPRFIRLAVEPTPLEYLLGGTPPIAEQLANLQQTLNAG
jgi:thiamine pyrophosphate-dependent acetolactate synthase large subunit-like protein